MTQARGLPVAAAGSFPVKCICERKASVKPLSRWPEVPACRTLKAPGKFSIFYI